MATPLTTCSAANVSRADFNTTLWAVGRGAPRPPQRDSPAASALLIEHPYTLAASSTLASRGVRALRHLILNCQLSQLQLWWCPFI
jgi:hypothetical protein